MKTLVQNESARTEEEIFKEALDLFIENVETKEDYLRLNEFLEKQTNYIPLMTTNRGSYNAVWDVKKMLTALNIKDWTTFSDTRKLVIESINESLEKYEQIEHLIETVNTIAKNKLNEMINDSTFKPKDIVSAMFEIEDKGRKDVIEKVDYLEELANVYATMNIIRAFKDIQETRNLTINLKKLRGVLLDLKFAEDGTPYIKYDVMIKRGTPAAFGAYKTKRYTGTIEL